VKKRIIFIERDPMRRNACAAGLRLHGFDVTPFDCGKDGLSFLLSNPVSAVVLNYGSSYEPLQPLAEGKRVVQALTDIDTFVPLILVCDRSDTLEQEISSAADVVLRQPITAAQLAEALTLVFSETLKARIQRKSRFVYSLR
jgi:DNA-binding response OmpR family regulator